MDGLELAREELRKVLKERAHKLSNRARGSGPDGLERGESGVVSAVGKDVGANRYEFPRHVAVRDQVKGAVGRPEASLSPKPEGRPKAKQTSRQWVRGATDGWTVRAVVGVVGATIGWLLWRLWAAG